MLPRIALASLLLTVTVWGCTGGANNGSLTHDPAVPTAGASTEPGEATPKGESFYAVFNTSKGDVIVEVNPGWAPQGAARFKELVEANFYDGCRFFRVLDDFMAQVGMNGDPQVNSKWQDNTIPDDPVLVSNTRGRVTFATSGPNSRTSQIFFNYADKNRQLDAMGFSPFGEVIEGMEVLESLYSNYGEGAPNGSGPSQSEIRDRGNDYLNESFPNLDYINSVRLYDTAEAAHAAVGGAAEPAADAGGETATEAAPGDEPAAETPAEPADQ